LVLMLCCTTAFVYAERQPNISISQAKSASITGKPNTMTTAVFRIRNDSSESLQITPEAKLPNGWRLGSPLFPLNLKPGGKDIVLMSFVIPKQVEAGKYAVKCGIKGADIEPASIFVSIERSVGIELKLLSAPKTVLSGSAYENRFLLSNTSNVKTTVKLNVATEKGFQVNVGGKIFDSLEYSLDPAASKEIKLTVFSPEDLPRKIEHFLRVHTEITRIDGRDLRVGEKQEKHSAEALSKVSVIPVSPGGERYHKLPLSVVMDSSYKQNGVEKFSNNVSLRANGAVEDSGEHRISLNASFPSFPKAQYSMERGTYNAGYSNSIFRIAAGDSSYPGSSLVAGKTEGRGIEGRLYFKQFSVDGYYGYSDTYHLKDPVAGGSMQYKHDNANKTEVKYLYAPQYKDKDDGEATADNTSNIKENSNIVWNFSVRPYDSADVDISVAAGLGNIEQYSYILKLENAESWYDYGFEMKYGSPAFSGNLGDTEYYSGNTSLKPVQNMKFNASYTFEKHNLALDTSQPLALATENMRFGMYYAAGNGLEFTGKWKRNRKRDLLSSPRYNSQKDSYSLNADWNTPFLEISGKGSIERLIDFENFTLTQSEKLALDAVYKPLDNLKLNNKFTLNTGSRRGLNDASFSYNFLADYKPNENTTLKSGIKTTFYQEYMRKGFINLSTQIKHTFSDDSVFSVKGSYRRDRSTKKNDDFGISLSYRRSVKIPVSPRSDIGAVSGQIINRTTGKGVGEVIIKVGSQTTVTNSEGHFYFPAVKEGDVFVSIDASRHDTKYIATGEMPRKIIVKSGETQNVNLQIVRPGIIHGQAMQYKVDKSTTGPGKSADDAEMLKDQGVKNILLELESKYGVIRRLTRNDGTFVFRDLVPGKWTLTVLSASLSESYSLEQKEYTVEISPGKTNSMEIKILPVIQQIQFLQEGEAIEVK